MKKYTIGEVSRLLGVKNHVIRYWEEEIPFIAPKKSSSGRRVYSDRDVQNLLRIKHLLYNNKYTIEGARRKIWAELSGSNLNLKSRVAEIRSNLLDIWDKIQDAKERTVTEQEIIGRFTKLGQEHLFACWHERGEEGKKNLLEDLRALDLDLLGKLQASLRNSEQEKPVLEPISYLSREEWLQDQKARELGEELLASGKAAFLTVAGGQGSRLGFDAPKGMFPISPIRQASLFQLFAENIASARKRYAVPLYWLIMTSPLNHQTTVDFFEQNASYWGLKPEEIHFFPQGLNPSLSEEGKLILNEEGGLFKNPDGHGGVIAALWKAGLHEMLEKKGVEEIFCFQVDNPLVKIPDPCFLGIHRRESSEMSTKVIEKGYPEEKIGTIGFINGKPGIIEYSDLDEEHMYARDREGKLLFSHGSIAIHILNLSFTARVNQLLSYHKARKKVKVFIPKAGGGSLEEREAIKFEKFIFDAISQACNPVFFETSREEEFAPLKNKTGVDSIETCTRAYIEKQALWLESCGVSFPRDEEGRPLYKVEISPLYAPDPETLKKRIQGTVNKINEDTLFA